MEGLESRYHSHVHCASGYENGNESGDDGDGGWSENVNVEDNGLGP
jgi:hypothetical protein